MMAHPGARAAAVAALALGAAGCAVLGDPMTRGQRALDRGDHEAALAAYNEAIAREDPATLVVAYANRCIANGALDHTDAAVADCTAALEAIDANGLPEGVRRAEILNNRAVVYIRKRDRESAIADLDEAIELEPEYAEAYANRGRAYNDLEDYERAIEDLDRAIELNDAMSDAYGNRAFAHQNLGDLDAAYADYERAVAIDNNPTAYFNRAMLRYTYGEFDAAYEDFLAVTRYAPEGDYNAFIASEQAKFLEGRPSASAMETAASAGEGDPAAPEAEAATAEPAGTPTAGE